jgi:hypothetical protein
VAIGRKNWLFVGSDDHAQTRASPTVLTSPRKSSGKTRSRRHRVTQAASFTKSRIGRTRTTRKGGCQSVYANAFFGTTTTTFEYDPLGRLSHIDPDGTPDNADDDSSGTEMVSAPSPGSVGRARQRFTRSSFTVRVPTCRT